jgi:hypothetical protein
MIHAIATDLGVALKAQKCPIKVFDGRESTKATTPARERIVVEYDDQAGDSFIFPRGAHTNPRMPLGRMIGMKVTIYAQSSSIGTSSPAAWEHRRRANQILDLALVALHGIAQQRRVQYQPGKGRFVPLADQDGSEVDSCAVYEMTFVIERGVFDTTWAGAKRPETTVGGVDGVSISNTVQAGINGSDDFETVIPFGE